MSSLARGIRNNNPGNLIITSIAWQGKKPVKQNTDGKFEQFETMEHGIRAMFRDLINDIKKGKDTVTKLINEYAPPSENNTQKYIEDVSKAIGVTPNQKITAVNSKFLLMLGKAIIKKENGLDASKVSDSQIRKALSMLGDVSDSDLKVTIQKTFNVTTVLSILLVFYTVFTFTL